MDKAFSHVAMTSVLSALIGVLLLIMVVLNRPFIGPLGIEPEPSEASLKLFELIDSDFKQIEAKSHGESPAPDATGGESHAH